MRWQTEIVLSGVIIAHFDQCQIPMPVDFGFSCVCVDFATLLPIYSNFHAHIIIIKGCFFVDSSHTIIVRLHKQTNDRTEREKKPYIQSLHIGQDALDSLSIHCANKTEVDFVAELMPLELQKPIVMASVLRFSRWKHCQLAIASRPRNHETIHLVIGSRQFKIDLSSPVFQSVENEMHF